jgi:hypothetical protein
VRTMTPTNLTDIEWHGGSMVTIIPSGATGTTMQVRSASTSAVSSTITVSDGTPLRLLNLGNSRLLLVTLTVNKPRFLIYNQSFTMEVDSLNTPPQAGPMTVYAAVNTPISFPSAKLVARATDADGDSIGLNGFQTVTSAGGSLVLASGQLTYAPPSGFSGQDIATYTLIDSRSRSTQATFSIVVLAPVSSENAPLIQRGTTGVDTIIFNGIPGRSYQVQTSTDLSTWTPLPQGSSLLLTLQEKTPPSIA